MWICEIIFLVLMPIGWAYRDAPDFPSRPSWSWHSVGWVLRALPAVFIIQDTWLTLTYGFYFWIIFELAINHFTKKDLFYIDVSTLSGELLRSFYISGKAIAVIKLILMFLFLTIYFI